MQQNKLIIVYIYYSYEHKVIIINVAEFSKSNISIILADNICVLNGLIEFNSYNC